MTRIPFDFYTTEHPYQLFQAMYYGNTKLCKELMEDAMSPNPNGYSAMMLKKKHLYPIFLNPGNFPTGPCKKEDT